MGTALGGTSSQVWVNSKKILLGTLLFSIFFIASCGQKSAPSEGPEQALNLLPEFSAQIVEGSLLNQSDPIRNSVVMIYGVSNALMPYVCTGTVISEKIILTAAHCISPNIENMMIVLIGNKDFADNESLQLRIDQTLVHPDYSDSILNAHDLALIKTKESLPKNYIPIDIDFTDEFSKSQSTLTVAGFGISDPEKKLGAGTLRRAEVRIFNPNYSETEIQILQEQGPGLCHGDSGGPAFILKDDKYFVFGVIARGETNCREDGIITKLYSENEWLKSAIESIRNETTKFKPIRIAR